MSHELDRLYELLPLVYRQRDAEQGYPLRALLQVINEQVHLVEGNLDQLYDNWFIETCEDWVVPYIGALVGYRPVHQAGQPDGATSPRGRMRTKILIPRRDVANTVRYRRRKGTLALLELLARDVAGWPARAVEFYRLLGWTQAIRHLRLDRGRTVDLRLGDALDRLGSPFYELAHTVEVRRINSRHKRGRYNLPSVGLFVWRLKAYSVTRAPAYCLEGLGPYCFTFSVLGNNTPLYTCSEPESDPTQIAGEPNLPIPIRRRAFEERVTGPDGAARMQASGAYYGEGKSLTIWAPDWPAKGAPQPVAREHIIPTDLSGWQYMPPQGRVAVDPVLGRIAFSPRSLPKRGVTVSYYYGFSADIGGGEYDRPVQQPPEARVYQVHGQEQLRAALAPWQEEELLDSQPPEAVIEILDSGVYQQPINLTLQENHSLQLRAANRKRPVIRLLDWYTDRPDALSVEMGPGSRFTLDGLLITGRGVQVQDSSEEGDEAEGPEQAGPGPEQALRARVPPPSVIIRHSTLVPGWDLDPECEPRRPAEPSLTLVNTQARVTIEHSIVGSIQVNLNQVTGEPIPIRIRDSIVDATGADCDSPECEAVGAPNWPLAHAVLTVERTTVFGRIYAHAIELAENSIFMGRIRVGRRQRGCMRFCYVTANSRTPRRYRCQPDLVETPIRLQFAGGELTEKERDVALASERQRVRPQFNSTRYSTPTYAQLAGTCAEEIKRGADDESEMGVFHDLYQPQRAENLQARLEEYTPAGSDVGIIYAS
jgi:hypothetical protein